MKKRTKNTFVILMMFGTIGIVYSLSAIALKLDEVSNLIYMSLMGVFIIVIADTMKHERGSHSFSSVKEIEK